MSKSLRVLVVEDSEDDALLMLRELQGGGYDLTSERVDTAEAMTAALDEQEWDIVIADYSMPMFSGFTALALLKNRELDIPFILVSGAVGEDIAVEAMKAGAHDYIMKDNLTRLVPAVERELRDAEVRRERRQAEEELKRAGKEWKRTFDSMSDWVSIHDADMNIVRANGALGKNLGVPPEELIGKKCYNVFHNREEPLEGCPLVKSTLSKKPENIEVFEPYLDRWLSVKCSPIFDEKGEVRGTVHVVRDVTERKRAEEALRESEEKFRSLAEQSPSMIFINKKGEVVYANKRCEEIMGYKREEFYSPDFDFLSLIAPESRDHVKASFSRHMKGEEVPPYEYTLVTKDGKKIPAIDTTKLILYEGENALLGIITDITERKRAEELIKASLEEKEVLLKEIHHRVKNNLQIISSLLYLQSKGVKDEKTLEVFRDSQSCVKSMALIHEKIYASGDLAKIDFGEYIRDLTDNLFSSYGINADKVALKIDVKDVSFGVNLAVPCGLIINELISNSLKHAFPEGKTGEIVVSLRVAKEKEVELIVSDNGIGIPEDLDYKNTDSLGTQLVVNLVEKQLKGTIELDRKGGTTLTIKFKI